MTLGVTSATMYEHTEVFIEVWRWPASQHIQPDAAFLNDIHPVAVADNTLYVDALVSRYR
jgi:hypothetical protein